MTTPETLLKYLTDMHALESHFIAPLKSQAKDADFDEFPQAKALVQRMLARSENAMWSLDNVIKELEGGPRSGFKSTITAAVGAFAAVINEGRTHAITKKLRDDYTALSLVSIGYELLHATSNALGSSQVAAISQANLKETAGLIMELSQEIIPVAVAELAKTNTADTSTVGVSQANILEAWQNHGSH